MLIEKTFNTGEVLINYAEGPDNGPPVLLLHGAGSIWQDWEPVIQQFYEKSHIYAPDFRGCGKSGRVPRGYRCIDFATDTVKFIRSKVDEPVVIIGHSLGAMTAIKLSADFPRLVRAVILEDPPLYLFEYFEDWLIYPVFPLSYELADSGLTGNEIARIFMKRLNYDEAEAKKLGRSIAHIDPDLLSQTMDKTIREGFDTDVLMRRISCPVLLVHGKPALGSAIRQEDIKRVSECLPFGSTVVIMEGLGHGLHTVDPQGFNRIISGFLNPFLGSQP